ncbi:MAG: Rrf2 family transcriptional regulator [Candidatus Krumholzibacteriia bacterium]
MMSQTSRYAFHVLGFLASHGGRLIPGDELAAATGIPANYLVKILNQLRKGGLVESRKGWGGGFALKPGAEDRPILDVVEIIEGQGAGAKDDCAFGRPACDAGNPCPMHEGWAEIRDGYHALLASTLVRDLAFP